MRVRWEELEQTRLYEDMVSVLLSRLHPSAERIDGSGGDGGRDVQLRRPGRLDLFELKSFTGRLTSRNPNRRSQVEESLQNAAAHQPDEWSLVVPINHNPGELNWFNSLKKKYPFPLVWLGRTWLEENLAKFPDITRFYLEDANAEVVNLLKELRGDDKPLVGGIEDAIERLDRLRTRLNEIDPQYRFEITPGPMEVATTAFPEAVMFAGEGTPENMATVSVIPKYRDAVRDRPIMINMNVAFPATELGDDAAAKFRAFLEYGDPVVVEAAHVETFEVDAPAGLGGTLAPGALRIFPAEPNPGNAMSARITSFSDEGAAICSLPIQLVAEHRGQRGVVVSGGDITGVLKVRARVELEAHRVEFNVSVGRPEVAQMPNVLLGPLRLALSLRQPNSVLIAVKGRELWRGEDMGEHALVSGSYVELIEQLAQIQDRTNTPFAIAGDLDVDAIKSIRYLARLFDGEAVPMNSGPITLTMATDSARPWHGKPGGLLAFESNFVEELMGEVVPLGVCNVIGGPWLVEENVVSGEAESGDMVAATLTPTSDAKIYFRHGSLREVARRAESEPGDAS